MNKKECKLIGRDATIVKIKCCYCEIADTCKRKHQKERYESKGVITYCSLTPNRPNSKRSKRKRTRQNKNTNQK